MHPERQQMRSSKPRSTEVKCCRSDVRWSVEFREAVLSSDEHLVTTETGKVVRARSVGRLFEEFVVEYRSAL